LRQRPLFTYTLLLRETSRRHKVHAPRHITKLKLNQTTGPVSLDKVHERGGRWARPLNKEGVGSRQREEEEGGTRRVISLAVSPSPPRVCGCLSPPIHPSHLSVCASVSLSLHLSPLAPHESRLTIWCPQSGDLSINRKVHALSDALTEKRPQS
jgi:hypothetical protein